MFEGREYTFRQIEKGKCVTQADWENEKIKNS